MRCTALSLGRSRIISLLAWIAGAALLPTGATTGAEARSLVVSVVGIADGDTLTVLDSNRLQHKVRLSGIDAPEKNQPFGDRSRQNLSARVHGKTVRVEWSKEDRYGRWVAKVLLEPPAGCQPSCAQPLDVNLEQVRAGLAWHYKQYESEQPRTDRQTYAQAEQTARAERIGLWSDPHPVMPWDWRQGPSDGPVRKSRSNICHAPEMPSYNSVQYFTSFATMEDCIVSGGRPPKTR